MKTISINRFDNGMADSRFSQTVGQFSVSKHFDINAFPFRLLPYRGMAVDTGATTNSIGNIIVGSDGLFYGLGTDQTGNPTTPRVWKKADNATDYAKLANSSGSSPVDYNLFVEYHDYFYYMGNSRYVGKFDRTGVVGANASFLDLTSYTNCAQGVFHPKDDILYIPYDNKIATVNGTTGTAVALTLPSYLTITSIAPWGNYLAIACAPTGSLTTSAAGGGFKSVVYLWDRDTSLTTVSESIDWGTGVLRVLNVLDGVLIGISDSGGSSANIQDRDSIVIKGYAGGTPFIIKEISTEKMTTTFPDAVINPRVNFIYRNKLHFSVNIKGGSTSPNYYGVWTLGKSKISGQYAVNLERVATNDNSETGVIACAISGDYASMVHTAVGTLTFSINTSAISAAFAATSIYESLVNPGMPAVDFNKRKKLNRFSVFTAPLTSSGQVVAKYRVDGGSWTTVFTKTSTSPDTDLVGYSQTGLGDTQFTDGRHYEFRLESTGGAEILGYEYEYDLIDL